MQMPLSSIAANHSQRAHCTAPFQDIPTRMELSHPSALAAARGGQVPKIASFAPRYGRILLDHDNTHLKEILSLTPSLPSSPTEPRGTFAPAECDQHTSAGATIKE